MTDSLSFHSSGGRHFESPYMGILKKGVGLFLLLLICVVSFYFFARYERDRAQVLSADENISFMVLRGDTTIDVARHLSEAGLIRSESAFLWYLVETGQWGKFIAGKYVLRGEVSFDSIARKLVAGEVVPKSIRVTFPEGFTAKQIAKRLSEQNLPGETFLRLVQSPTTAVLQSHEILSSLPVNATLEGFLFPDTYEFALQASAEDIVDIFLSNFERRFDDSLQAEMHRQQRTLFEVVIMASLLEAEVRTESDRKLVSDLFSRRLRVGMPLQSDATVRYALGIDKAQYSGVDIATDSPYNTYTNKGLPVGPIDNPGIISLRSALFPTANDFWYFLSDQQTGETVFSRDFEEHKRNKALHGL